MLLHTEQKFKDQANFHISEITAGFCAHCNCMRSQLNEKCASSQTNNITLPRFYDDMNYNCSSSRCPQLLSDNESGKYRRHFSTSKSLFYSTSCALDGYGKFNITYPNQKFNTTSRFELISHTNRNAEHETCENRCRHCCVSKHWARTQRVQAQRLSSPETEQITRSPGFGHQCHTFRKSCSSPWVPKPESDYPKNLRSSHDLSQVSF